MSTLTTTYLNAVANYLRGAGAPVAITALYLDLYNGDPQGAGSSVLSTLTGSSTRTDVASSMGAASGGVSTNTATITITASASGSASVSYVAFFTASTAGTLIMSHALATSRSVTTGDTVEFAASDLSISQS